MPHDPELDKAAEALGFTYSGPSRVYGCAELTVLIAYLQYRELKKLRERLAPTRTGALG
jgi:hypothetical protein